MLDPRPWIQAMRFLVRMRVKRAESTAERLEPSKISESSVSEYQRHDDDEHDSGDSSPPPQLVVINDVGMEDEADDVVDGEEEEIQMPCIRITAKTSDRNGAKRSESTESFGAMPALSPAHSIQRLSEDPEVKMEVTSENDREEEGEGEEEEEEEEEEDVKPFVSPPPKKKKKKAKKPEESPKKEAVGGLRKIESSPALVRLEKEKKTTMKKKSSEDSVPHIDPNAPKRNRSAYVHFIISRRAKYSKATMSQRDINIALAGDWQKLSEDDRQPFHKSAEDEKRRYLELMEEYKKTDSHKQYQQKRAKFMQSRKRKHGGDDSDDDGHASRHHHQMAFPKTSVFCPLLSSPTTSSSSESSTSAGLQYVGPIFTPEFMAYNKARDSYRRQLAIERSNVEHELEALHEHDLEVKIEKQGERIDEIDEKIDGAMKVMNKVFAGIAGAREHLSDIDSLTEWLRTVTRMSTRDSTRKLVRESLHKYCKSHQQKK